MKLSDQVEWVEEGGRGVPQKDIFKGKYEAKLKFPVGLGRGSILWMFSGTIYTL